MTPEEIIAKCAEFGIKLKVVNNKLSPIGNLSLDFVKFSHTIIPYKQQLIDYLRANAPEEEIKITASDESPKPIVVQTTSDARVQRLRIPCVHLGPTLEKPAGCNCAGKIMHECKVYGKCRRAGNPGDGVAACAHCDRCEPSA